MSITSAQSAANGLVLDSNGWLRGFLVNKKTSGYIHTSKRQYLPPHGPGYRCPVFHLPAFYSLQPLGVDPDALQWRGSLTQFT